MEPYEKLKNLPDADKVKYFEALLESIKLASGGSDDPDKSSSEKLKLSTIFTNLTTGHNSPEGNSRKKQKTLDSWLIKPKNLSPSKDKEGESSSTLDSWLVKSKTISPHKSNVGECINTVENSNKVSLDSNVSNSSQPRINSTEPSSSDLDACSSLGLSKNNEKSPQTEKEPLSKSNEVENYSIKNIEQCSPTKVCEAAIAHTKSYSLRSKRKRNKPSLISESPVKSSTDINNTALTKSNRDATQSDANKFDINQDILPANIHSNLSCKNDCLEIDKSLNKNTRIHKSKKSSNSNLHDVVQSDTKYNNQTKFKDLHMNDKTPSRKNELQVSIHSSSQSNWEAFQILEAACTRINLNVLEILENENIQNVLNDSKRLDNDAVFLINSFKSNGKFLPVVHLVESRKKLTEILKKMQKPIEK